MGIKFFCPSGHKLHVKSFLAGKKALCPKCGARVIVPHEDQEGADADGLGAEQGDDPLSDSLGAVWYVRPSSGGQYGPATGEVMRGWIAEGRVAANTLVWRDGWPNWQSAATVFPQLVAVLPVATAVASSGAGAGPLSSTPSGAMHGAPGESLGTDIPFSLSARRRQRYQTTNLWLSLVLGALSVLLLIALVIVVVNQSGSEESPPEEPAATNTPLMAPDASETPVMDR